MPIVNLVKSSQMTYSAIHEPETFCRQQERSSEYGGRNVLQRLFSYWRLKNFFPFHRNVTSLSWEAVSFP